MLTEPLLGVWRISESFHETFCLFMELVTLLILQLAANPVDSKRAKSFESWISYCMFWGGQKLMVEILKIVRYITAGGGPLLIIPPNLSKNR